MYEIHSTFLFSKKMLALSHPVRQRNSFSSTYQTPHPCGDVLSSREIKNSRHGFSIVSNPNASKTLPVDQTARVSARNMNRYPFKHQYGWSIDNILPPYKFKAEAVLPLPQYSWKTNVLNVQTGLQKQDKFLPRGGVVPRIVDSGGDDGYPALPPDLDEEGRIKNLTAVPNGGTSGGLGTKRAAVFREKDISNQNQELKRIRQLLEGGALSRGVVHRSSSQSTQTTTEPQPPPDEDDNRNPYGGGGGRDNDDDDQQPPRPPRPYNPLIPFFAGLAYEIARRRPRNEEHRRGNNDDDDYYDDNNDDDNNNRQIHERFIESYPPHPPPPPREPIVTEPDDEEPIEEEEPIHRIDSGKSTHIFQPLDDVPIIDIPSHRLPPIPPITIGPPAPPSTDLIPHSVVNSHRDFDRGGHGGSNWDFDHGRHHPPIARPPPRGRNPWTQDPSPWNPTPLRSPDDWRNIAPRTDFASFFHDNNFNNHGRIGAGAIATLIGHGMGTKDAAGLSAVMTLAGGLIVARGIADQGRLALSHIQRLIQGTANDGAIVGTLYDFTRLSSPMEGPPAPPDPDLRQPSPTTSGGGSLPNNRIQNAVIKNLVDGIVAREWEGGFRDTIFQSEQQRAEFIASVHGTGLLQDWGDAPPQVHRFAPERIPITPPEADLNIPGSSQNPYHRAMAEIQQLNLAVPSNYIQISQNTVVYLYAYDRENLADVAVPYRRVGAVFIRQDNLPSRRTAPQDPTSRNPRVTEHNEGYDREHDPVPLVNNIRTPTLYVPAGGFMVSWDALRMPTQTQPNAPQPSPTATELPRRVPLPIATQRPTPYVDIVQNVGPRRSARIRNRYRSKM